MSPYLVTAEREGDAWTAIVENLDGVITWGKGLRHLEQSVREAIALMIEVEDEHSFDLLWSYRTGDSRIDKDAQYLRSQRADFARIGSELSSSTQELVQSLRTKGYSVRDTAAISGISPARVAQIAPSHVKRAAS